MNTAPSPELVLRAHVRRVVSAEAARVLTCHDDHLRHLVKLAGIEVGLLARALPGWVDEEAAGVWIRDAASRRGVSAAETAEIFDEGRMDASARPPAPLPHHVHDAFVTLAGPNLALLDPHGRVAV